NDYGDLSGAKYFLCVGKNIADTGHSDMHFLFDAMEQGLKFVMVDPRFSRSAAKADEWLAPRPGTDVALGLGMIHTVISDELLKTDYILKHTNLPFLVNSADGKFLRERDLRQGGGDGYLVWDDSIGAPASAVSASRPALRGRWRVDGAD